MSFHTIVFLLYFFPLIAGLYIFLRVLFRKPSVALVFLLFASIVFYVWSAGVFSAILFLCTIVNWIVARSMVRLSKNRGKTLLWAGIAFNLTLFMAFKYGPEILQNPTISPLLHTLPSFLQKPLALPLGMSFYIFQGISYLVDCYKQRMKTSFFKTLLYFSFFPKLPIGPIIRWGDIRETLFSPTFSVHQLFEGFTRFTFGLAKKVLLADALSPLVSSAFSVSPEQLPQVVAWVGILAYTLQLYLDFSGYMDMALGIARILGVRLPENFKQPYTSASISEFWGRWHITLSSWLRDYVYIPLGGNRKGIQRTVFNIMVVFAVSGVWHGTGNQYLFWGLYHGAFISAEQIFASQLSNIPRTIRQILTFLTVTVGWVFFRSPSLPHAQLYVNTLFGSFHTLIWPVAVREALNETSIIILTVAVLFVILEKQLVTIRQGTRTVVVRGIAAIVLFIYSLMILSTSTFSPFLYFQY